MGHKNKKANGGGKAKNKNTGAEITEEDVDMEWTLEVLEKEIRGCWGDGDFFDEAYDDYEY